MTFSLRKTVSLTLGLSFLVMTVTGLVLFITPQGKVAYWSHWTLMGLGKEEWAGLHITSMVLLLVTGIWHIYYNWTPLVSYLKEKAKGVNFLKREFVAAVLLNTLFVAGTLFALPPFQTLLDLNDAVKGYWQEMQGSPPYGHAEESTLAAFAGYLRIEPDTAIDLLRAKGIAVEGKNEVLLEIAQRNGVTPQALYDALKVKDRAKSAETGVTFLGRRTLEELARMEKIDLERSLAYLEKKGLSEAGGMRMKQIADHFEMTPLELFETLQKVSRRAAD